MSDNLGTFINLMTDFGFKRIFGSEQYKPILIKFLNVMFEKDGIVVDDATYHDKEVLPADADGKRIVYDVYCTTPNDKEHFILEMQKIYHQNFEKRVIYYIAKAFASQGKSGDKYDYSPVLGIFFVDFQFKHLFKRQFHDFRLTEMDTHQVFSNHLRLMIVCLEEAKLTWGECITDLDKLTFIIKNMHKMDKESEAYKSGEYKEMFEASEIGSMAKEDIVAYSKSKRHYEDMLLCLDYAKEEGREEGREEGMEEGIKKGIRQTAREMLANGISPDIIKKVTKLTEGEY